MIRIIAAVAISLCVASLVSAELVDFGGTPIEIEGWYGSGENQSILLVDFGAASYAFGYQWSDATTSFDMLQGVAAESDFDFTYTDSVYGAGIDSMTYDGYTMQGFDGYPTDWMGYWLSDNGVDWVISGSGVSANMLTDGSWDGWSHETDFGVGEWGYDPQNTPVRPVPEPGTILLFLVGGAIAVTRHLKN